MRRAIARRHREQAIGWDVPVGFRNRLGEGEIRRLARGQQRPLVAPQDDSTGTAEPVEAENEEQLAPANDNAPAEPTPATGTDG